VYKTLKDKNDKPTIGILLCKDKDNVVVDFALESVTHPLGVSQFPFPLERGHFLLCCQRGKVRGGCEADGVSWPTGSPTLAKITSTEHVSIMFRLGRSYVSLKCLGQKWRK